MSAFFVTNGNGDYLVQITRADGSFFLADEDQTWESGFGCGWKTWRHVDRADVPGDEEDRLGWIIDTERAP